MTRFHWMRFCRICCFVYAGTVLGDVVTFVDHEALNGKVIYGQSFVCMKARFRPNISRAYAIPRNAIEKVEFTETDFNPGPPPIGLTSFPSASEPKNICVVSGPGPQGGPRNSEKAPIDSIILRNGSIVKGGLVSIDEKTVVVFGNRRAVSLKRARVRAILMK